MGSQSDPLRYAKLVVLVVVLVLLALFPVTVGLAHSNLGAAARGEPADERATPMAGLSVRKHLVATGFQRLSAGRMTPAGFGAALGGEVPAAPELRNTSVVSDAAGHKSLRVTLQKDTVIGSPADGVHGLNVFVPLPHPLQQACLHYRVRFGAGFDWSLGGKLPGLLGVAPGTDPALPTGGRHPGRLGWSGRIMWLGPGAYSMPGRANNIASYMYGPTQAGDYGDNVWWDQSFTSGTWHTLTQCYAMNTVTKTGGSAPVAVSDGVLRAWFDGTEVVNRTDYVFRTRNDVAISHLAWSIFRGGHTLDWASPTTGTVDFDDVAVTQGLTPPS